MAALMLLAILLGSPNNVMGQTRSTKTEGFETKAASTSYQGTVDVTAAESDCGISWQIYYGCVSTSSKISGNKSAAIRLYNSNIYGYIKTTTAVDGLTNVALKAKAQSGIKIDIAYSTDGSSWTNIETNKTIATLATSYDWDIPSGGKYFKVSINSNSTKPTSGNKQLTIDDVVFTYTASTTPAVTATPTSLSGFSYIQGQGPSESQQFTVSGVNLGSNNISVSVTDDYEISSDNSTFGSSVTPLIPTAGIVSETTLYVRMKKDLTGTPSGTITAESSGATPQTITLSGSVTPTYTLTISATNGHIEDGDGNTITTGAVAQGAEFEVTAVPNTGYKFASWAVSGNGSSVAADDEITTTFTMGSAAATLTANFSARTPATVTLNHGEGGISTTNVNTYTDATLGEVIEGQTPGAVNGWTFYGWVKSYTSGTPTLITNSEEVGETTNLYAVYKKGSNTFSLVTSTNDLAADAVYMIACYHSSTYKFMNNPSGNYMEYVTGNTVSDGSYEYAVGKKFVLGGTEGAYTLIDGSNYLTATSNQQYLGLATASGNPTNYQKWAITFSNSYVQISNNGNSSNKIVSYHTGQGYFNCWTSSSLYLYKQITNDLTYSIAPTAEKCHVYYDANSGTGTQTDDNDYDVGDEVTVLGPGTMTRTGHDFFCWSDMEDGNTPGAELYDEGGKFNIVANITLYAQWSIKSYSYELTDDDNSYAILEVDDVELDEDDEIEFGKEVTVNVTVTEGYVYHISVVNDATSESVTVTNDKFIMPASSVTVTVTSEVNPYATIELTSGDMEDMDNAGTGYADGLKTITINGYYWEAKAYNTSNNKDYLQINTPGTGNAAGSYIKLPIVNGKIETITCTVNSSYRYLYFNTTNSTSNPIATGGNGTAATSITIDMTNVVYQTGYIVSSGSIQITNISVKYRPYQDMSGTTLPTTLDEDVTISIPSSTNATATDLTIPESTGIIIKSGASLKVSGTLTNSGNSNNLIIEDGGQLILNNNNTVKATVKKTTAASSAEKTEANNLYAIASPINNIAILSFAQGTHNVYRYDEPNSYWNEYRSDVLVAPYLNPFDVLEIGRGYLYRSDDEGINFAGDVTGNEVTYNLSYAFRIEKYKGLNLVGNPFTHDISWSNLELSNVEDGGCYVLNEDPTDANHGKWQAVASGSVTIKPMQAFFVQATNNGASVTFNNTAAKGINYANDNIMFSVKNSKCSDEAYVLFKEGHGLNKIEHRNNEIPMLYIINNGQNYAIADMSDDTEVINIGFEAKTMGQYTLSVKTEGQYSYMHLIDKLTGEDVDMLSEDSYTFVGTPNDRKDRFVLRLNYNAANIDTESDIFAYQSGSDIIVRGEGELQIFDVMGRFVMSQHINGVNTINADALSNGVYVLRIIGTEIKTQKIVVR